MAAEVRCPNNHTLAIVRQHGIGRLIALLFVPLGIGLPAFVYMTWRPAHIGDKMRCGLCQVSFTLTPALIGFPRGLAARSASAPAEAPGRFAPLLPVGLLLATIVGFGWLWVLLSLAVGFLPSATPTPAPPAELAEAVVQVAAATPTAAPVFKPYWVKNYELTDMWSGPDGQAGATSFGQTSSQFCAFLVVQAQDNARLYVLNPYTNNYLWIAASAVGPADPPQHSSEAPAADKNCSDVDPR